MTNDAALPGGPRFYESAGRGYAEQRRPDPRIAAMIAAALGDARSVLNVGAGAGSYEPDDRYVVAVEPSGVMLGQRTSGAPTVRAVSEALPFHDDSFDATLAVLTLHHWSDWRRGIGELQRVAPRTCIVTFDTESVPAFWLFEYFPQILARDRRRMPPLQELNSVLGADAVAAPIPHDCVDGFMAAYWRRPEAYLDERTRAVMSGFALLSPAELSEGLGRLESDLASGAWRARHESLLTAEALDVGYRLVVRGREVSGSDDAA
jgi:SAM-dependent methyltransferase